MNTGDVLERFEAEHDDALAALEKMEAAAFSLSSGASRTEVLANLREGQAYIATVLRRHNDEEERALFSVLGGRAPTGLFIAHHAALRGLQAELLGALEAANVQTAASVALSIVQLLRSHIDRENTALFPMARRLLGAEGLAEVARRLSEIDDAASR
ncbi:MAG: hemerythrin domain-containing protein [Gemmatimonadales bacterium]|jgi:hemerythrin-like domain-containing protein